MSFVEAVQKQVSANFQEASAARRREEALAAQGAARLEFLKPLTRALDNLKEKDLIAYSVKNYHGRVTLITDVSISGLEYPPDIDSFCVVEANGKYDRFTLKHLARQANVLGFTRGMVLEPDDRATINDLRDFLEIVMVKLAKDANSEMRYDRNRLTRLETAAGEIDTISGLAKENLPPPPALAKRGFHWDFWR
jgi:hypothetical protein